MAQSASSRRHDCSARRGSAAIGLIAVFALYVALTHTGASLQRKAPSAARRPAAPGPIAGNASDIAENSRKPVASSNLRRSGLNRPSSTIASGYASVSALTAGWATTVAPDPRTAIQRPVLYIRLRPPHTGLGNKMFQYASSLALALRHGCEAHLVVDHERIAASLASMKRVFAMSDLTVDTTAPSTWTVDTFHESGWGRYDSELFDDDEYFESNVTLVGYLQSWKYFQPVSDRIRREFSLTSQMAVIADSFFRNASVSHNELLVGIHVRRGDMVLYPELYTVAPPEFIKMAVDHYVAKYGTSHRLSFVFATNDRPWVDEVVARHLPRNLSVRHLSFAPEVDMAILSRCNHSVVTGGTFGWWSAWLAGGDVLYYKDFIGNTSGLYAGYDPADYYPPHWQGLA